MLKDRFTIHKFQSGKSQRGVTLFFAVVILTVILAIALGLSTILVAQTRMFRGMVDSVQAFFAADTGIERALYEGQSVTGEVDGATYEARFLEVEDCPPGTVDHCIISKGTFKETQRFIEVIR